MVELLPNQCLGPILINAQKWAWWHMMAHPSIREGRQEEQMSKVILSDVVSSRQDWATWTCLKTLI